MPNLCDRPIITRRYIEAAIMKNVFDEKAKTFDLNTAEQITERACLNSPMAHDQ